jgi:hypothetical protein
MRRPPKWLPGYISTLLDVFVYGTLGERLKAAAEIRALLGVEDDPR